MDVRDKETVRLYRAVGAEELVSIMETRQFALVPGGVEVKYFGLDFKDTLEFANDSLNNYVAAIVEVEIQKSVLDKIGDFTNVDTIFFKNGTVEIQRSNLFQFNNAIIDINYDI